MKSRGFAERQIRAFGVTNEIIEALGEACVHNGWLSRLALPAAWTAVIDPPPSCPQILHETAQKRPKRRHLRQQQQAATQLPCAF